MSMSMALAAYQTPTQGFCAIHTSQCAVRGGTEKVVAYFPIGNMSRCTAFNNHLCLSFVCRMAAGPVHRGKNQCCRVLAFRDVTKKDDSSGAEDPESDTPQISLSSDWRGMKEIKQSSFRTLSRFPGWFSKLQEQKFILRANEILQKPIARLKLLDGDQIVKELREDKFGHHILKLWQNSEVWIKWPLVIFLPWCFAVTILYGIKASSELLPLWLIGPFLMAALIKSSLFFYHLCVQMTTNIVTIGREAPAKCMEAMHNRLLAVQLYRQALEARRDELIVLMRSGKYKEILREKLKEYRVRKTDELYDVIDYWWPKWRQFERFLKKIF
ncbi:hypothetical protein SUGI_0641480 [Cryptomeria japonica]|uniref:uncharacterized protein LOC131067959 n=1 Tax=Cryptomeria japonica TaxID=3369 RepID=UPI002414CC27|nr:uncharacterized protein LOC131067959 [Cryptomeria japonica]GLJ31878.1 hypothetical protein SUGI_0641480 [Cryptomeria japonica]